MNGKPAMENDCVLAELKKGDLYEMTKPIHQQATNVYQTKDGKWYHLHGSMNASATMGMVGVEEQDVTREEAIKIFGDKVAQYDAAYLEKTANEELRQAGVTCLSPEEFFASEHGKIMADEPLWTMTPVPAPQSTWPLQKSDKFKPLEGIRVIDFSRVIAAPVISKVLAVLGAEVIKVSSKNLPDVIVTWIDLSAGKKDANIDLKSEEGKNAFRRLVAGADVLIDGYRPSVLDKLGFNSESLRKINQKLVYVRENCYGFKGPLAYRSGWQQISDCLFNIWYYRLGQYTADQCKALLARNEGFHVRHYNEMYSLIQKTHAAICKVRPELLKNPDYFSVMTGREWGVDDNISILAPPFKLETSVLEYAVPSGARGRSIPEWEA
ncbi:CAIB/BAIF family protein [Metarhizium acridum CQMa 102]|uniref:CAIB/BAIF family protein n=1 Tax=Metarhizium acridum (strain CQMa 102) TaxID=655827 RepID=E9DUD9_METAQ|nr:CAIB/BAIF family protein [Metarhizium acridum CQMa 102]EFY92601.1 CAIB/BAIF family protein [Metarhizium acridum CQMa 102]